MRELERIKKEREQERIKQVRFLYLYENSLIICQEQKRAEEESQRQSEAVIHGNPLLHQDYSIKRKYVLQVVLLIVLTFAKGGMMMQFLKTRLATNPNKRRDLLMIPQEMILPESFSTNTLSKLMDVYFLPTVMIINPN